MDPHQHKHIALLYRAENLDKKFICIKTGTRFSKFGCFTNSIQKSHYNVATILLKDFQHVLCLLR